MPLWLKIILGFVLVIVLCIAGIVGMGAYYWKKHGTEIVAGAQKTMDDGRTFGKTTDNQGCVDEAAARQRKVEGFTDLMKSGIFLRSCLDVSKRTPNFCEAVPTRIEFIKSAKWQQAQCDKYGLTEAQQCRSLFQQVQMYCEQHPDSTP
jgi:hypothetical protein